MLKVPERLWSSRTEHGKERFQTGSTGNVARDFDKREFGKNQKVKPHRRDGDDRATAARAPPAGTDKGPMNAARSRASG